MMKMTATYNYSNRNFFRNIVFLLLLLTTLSFPQEKKYFDAAFGGGGGYTPGWYMPNMDGINEQVKAFGLPELSSGFYTSGGAGFIYIGLIPGLRIGGMGYGGSTSESSNSFGVNKEVNYSLGGGGLTVEYSLPFIRNVGVSIGAVIGGGSMQIEVYQNSHDYEWENVWDSFSQGAGLREDISRKFSNSYWFISPTLNIDIPVYRFVTVRIGAGYQTTFGGGWTIDNDQELRGVPSDVNGNSFFIQSGIFIGFFSF